ncbi:MAG: aquaporin, partial [Acetobacteraceae bacterium]|nr:aquaporin [Acetobacteraceae bacterium]
STARSATPRPPGAEPDRPLDGDPHPHNRLHPAMYAAELAGTALLVAGGLSIVIALWGKGAPFSAWSIAPGLRRLLNGFLFGSVGAAIAYSPLGRISGAHINPSMTLAFWLVDKMKWRDAGCYVAAQLLGAAIGAAMLLLWGAVGASDAWGASVPARGLPIWWAVTGEAVCTFLLVYLIFAFAARPATQPFTPLVNPPLFALLTWLEAPVSGASANPARSFGPELIGNAWGGWWVYWVGPVLGAIVAVAVIKARVFGHPHPHQARLFHFGHPGGIAPR